MGVMAKDEKGNARSVRLIEGDRGLKLAIGGIDEVLLLSNDEAQVLSCLLSDLADRVKKRLVD